MSKILIFGLLFYSTILKNISCEYTRTIRLTLKNIINDNEGERRIVNEATKSPRYIVPFLKRRANSRKHHYEGLPGHYQNSYLMSTESSWYRRHYERTPEYYQNSYLMSTESPWYRRRYFERTPRYYQNSDLMSTESPWYRRHYERTPEYYQNSYLMSTESPWYRRHYERTPEYYQNSDLMSTESPWYRRRYFERTPEYYQNSDLMSTESPWYRRHYERTPEYYQNSDLMSTESPWYRRRYFERTPRYYPNRYRSLYYTKKPNSKGFINATTNLPNWLLNKKLKLTDDISLIEKIDVKRFYIAHKTNPIGNEKESDEGVLTIIYSKIVKQSSFKYKLSLLIFTGVIILLLIVHGFFIYRNRSLSKKNLKIKEKNFKGEMNNAFHMDKLLPTYKKLNIGSNIIHNV